MEFYKTDKANFKIIETGEGFLKAKITIARPGVFKYYNDDGSISNEAKLPDDIFSNDVIVSANGSPITDDHPHKNGIPILVNSQNYSDFVKGNISNVAVEYNPDTRENELVGIATIYDSDLIMKIKNKKQNEVSIGFVHEIENQSGFYKGAKYDIAQKNIRINHTALVIKGRAGETVKIHVDKKEKNIMADKWIVDGGNTSNLFTYRKFDGSTDIQVDQSILNELMIIKNDNKDKDNKIKNLERDNENLKKENENLKTDKKESGSQEEILNKLEIANDKANEWKDKYDELENSIPDIVGKASQERFDLIEFAKSVDSNMKTDGLPNKDIKLQIIAKGLPFKSGIKIDSLQDEIIDARFDAACELLRAQAVTNENKQKNYVGIDRDQINEKRFAMQNVYQREQEKIQGGKK